MSDTQKRMRYFILSTFLIRSLRNLIIILQGFKGYQFRITKDTLGHIGFMLYYGELRSGEKN